VESGHNRESSKQVAELEPRLVIVGGGGDVELPCDRDGVVDEELHTFDRYGVSEDVPGLVRRDLGAESVAMGLDELVDVDVRSDGCLEEVVRRVCPTLGVGESEAAKGADKSSDGHVERDGE
jgi:hypothetical protein